jgi:hypothetical protein
MRYVYKNESGGPINIGGYQFAMAGSELSSNIIINWFNEAVSNGFLSLRELKDGELVKESVNDPDKETREVPKVEFDREADAGGVPGKAREDEETPLAEEDRLTGEASKAGEAGLVADEGTRKVQEAETVKKSKN